MNYAQKYVLSVTFFIPISRLTEGAAEWNVAADVWEIVFIQFVVNKGRSSSFQIVSMMYLQ